jgi:glycosyltransferase involved in cell wall biosynthesis
MSEFKPLISVITVCYQAEEYIEQCMSSVISQSFENFEYIVIDGGSTDKTVSIIKKYADKLSYWSSKKDRGIAHGFNLGLKHAKGRWIVFLNSDDCYCDNQVLSSIEKTLLTNDNMELVYGQIQIIKRQKKITPITPLIGADWKWSDFRFKSTIPHPASFTNQRFFKMYGGFDESFRNAMDYEFYLRAGSNLRVKFIPQLLVWMRDGGISKREGYLSHRESKDAHVKHSIFNKFVANLIYVHYVIRVFLKTLFKY